MALIRNLLLLLLNLVGLLLQLLLKVALGLVMLMLVQNLVLLLLLNSIVIRYSAKRDRRLRLVGLLMMIGIGAIIHLKLVLLLLLM